MIHFLIPVVMFAIAAPVPSGVGNYGAWSDPEGDAKRKVVDGRLEIEIPGRKIWTRADVKKMRDAGVGFRIAIIKPCPTDSVRMWKDVTGDFTAVIKVAFPIRPGGEEQLETYTPRLGGLVVWQDDREHVGMVRAEEFAKKTWRESFHMIHTRPDGLRNSRADGPKQAGSGFVKVIRSGNTITSAYGSNGKDWTLLESEEVAMKETVKVGVYAKNASAESLTVVFDQFTLTQPRK